MVLGHKIKKKFKNHLFLNKRNKENGHFGLI